VKPPHETDERHSWRRARSKPAPTLRVRLKRHLFSAATAAFIGVALLLWFPPPRTENGKAQQGIKISKADFGKSWPFTVQDGQLRCVGTGVVVFSSGGTEYAVNGDPNSGGYASIQAIAKPAHIPGGPRINLLPIIDRGLRLCNRAPSG